MSDFKEQRVRGMTQLYYSKPEIQKAIFEFAKNREVCPRYFEGFGKRPDTLQYPADIFELVKRGATSLHCSEELWEDPLSIATEMTPKQFNELRIGWDLKGTYEDTGLVLRSEKDENYFKNTLLAKDLAKQVKARGIKFSSKNPVMIPLTELELKKADNDYGLTFKLREDAEIYEAPILSKQGKFNSKDIDEKTGLPKKVFSSGNRTLYGRDSSSLSRLDLYGDLDLDSSYGGLDGSSDNGRVVVVSGEATVLEKLKFDLIKRINKKYHAQLEEFNLILEKQKLKKLLEK